MSDDNSSQRTSGWVEIVRQITTPITLISLSLVSLPWIASTIADCTISPTFKGSLLSVVLAIFAGIMFASFYVAIKHPHQFTFDKEAHLKIAKVAVDGVGLEQAPDLLQLGNDLTRYATDPDFIQKLADGIKKTESPEESPENRAGG